MSSRALVQPIFLSMVAESAWLFDVRDSANRLEASAAPSIENDRSGHNISCLPATERCLIMVGFEELIPGRCSS